jgi:hypothetical protein
MTNPDSVTVTENDIVTRDPVTGAPVHTIERTVVRRDHSNWGLWIAGIAVFSSVLMLALLLLGSNNNPTADQVLAAQAEAETARLQADQALQDANAARMDATVTALNANSQAAGNQAASNAAAASASAAEAAAARASAAAAASFPQAPNPADAADPSEAYPTQ